MNEERFEQLRAALGHVGPQTEEARREYEKRERSLRWARALTPTGFSFGWWSS